MKYARARSYFEAHRWEEAAAGFRDIAMNHAEHEAAIFAAQLYLESLNVLLSHATPAHPACLADIGRDTPRLLELYCQGDKARENADQCAVLRQVKRDQRRLEAEQLVSSAKGSDPASLAALEKGAKAYLELWQQEGEGVCEGAQPGCDRMDEVLYNAARAFQAARLLAKAIAVRKILINPRYHLDRTELGRKTVLDIARNYQAIAAYDEAASFYERFARENPTMAEAPSALEDATILRLGLGQEEQATKDAELFQKSFADKHPARAARIAFAIGAHFVER